MQRENDTAPTNNDDDATVMPDSAASSSSDDDDIDNGSDVECLQNESDMSEDDEDDEENSDDERFIDDDDAIDDPLFNALVRMLVQSLMRVRDGFLVDPAAAGQAYGELFDLFQQAALNLGHDEVNRQLAEHDLFDAMEQIRRAARM